MSDDEKKKLKRKRKANRIRMFIKYWNKSTSVRDVAVVLDLPIETAMRKASYLRRVRGAELKTIPLFAGDEDEDEKFEPEFHETIKKFVGVWREADYLEEVVKEVIKQLGEHWLVQYIKQLTRYLRDIGVELERKPKRRHRPIPGLRYALRVKPSMN